MKVLIQAEHRFTYIEEVEVPKELVQDQTVVGEVKSLILDRAIEAMEEFKKDGNLEAWTVTHKIL